MLRKNMKRFSAALIALAIVCITLPSENVHAVYAVDTSGISWTKTDEYTYTTSTVVTDDEDNETTIISDVTVTTYSLDGTDVTATIDGHNLHISGTGAIPDYTERSWSVRPWHKYAITNLVIDETITSIGEYAFANLSYLEDITMSSKTFIENNNAFTGIAYEPVFHIKGYAETVKYIGTIPYTSLDSIKAFAQSTYMRASFLFDEAYMVTLFQNSGNPTITNVFCNYDTTTPWEDLDEYENGNVYTDICRIISPTSDGDLSVTCYKQCVNQDYYELFATAIGTDTLAATYVMEVERNDVLVGKTLSELYYELTIPEEYKLAGRTFRLISVDQGTVTVHEDFDLSDSTITFMTDTPSTIYALVYSA